MKMRFRTLLSATTIALLALSLTACGAGKIKVPDLAGSDLD